MKEFTQLQKWKIESLIEKYTNNDNGDFEIQLSKKIAYIDDEGKKFFGLKKDYIFNIDRKNIYIFDNHNKAIFYIFQENQKNKKFFDLVHIDAHRDDTIFQYKYPKEITEKNILEFYQKSRISDYLDLMKKTKMIGKIYNITQEKEFQNLKIPKNNFCLNLDIDIFGFDGQVVDLELKIKKTIEVWKKANFVMIATSPGFINQENAKFLIETFLKRI